MSRIGRLAIMFALINVVVLPFQLATPSDASAIFHNPPPLDNDCCKLSQEHVPFCCDQCCTTEDCDLTTDC